MRQETFSYRTSRKPQLDELSDLSEQAVVTRNGFTTYDPVYDQGHEFWTTKQSTRLISSECYIRGNLSGTDYFYRGTPVPKMRDDGQGQPLLPIPSPLDSSESKSLGQRAIINTAPTSPQASVATALGEIISDGLPALIGTALWKSQLRDYRSLGGEYLNVQFGWVPFISDLLKIVKSLRNATHTIQQLQRDDGRNVRRRFAFPTDVESSVSSFSGYLGPYQDEPYGGFIVNVPEVSVVDRIEKSVWFSGAYTYKLPTGSDLLAKLARYDAYASVLLGTRVTPEVVWELQPWSWLIDWKLSIGTALSAADVASSDNLVIRYGYLMCHQVATRTYAVPPTKTNLGFTVPATTLELRSERKERIRATPYGFGLNTSEFSLKKWAILGALGMSRGPGNLRG